MILSPNWYQSKRLGTETLVYRLGHTGVQALIAVYKLGWEYGHQFDSMSLNDGLGDHFAGWGRENKRPFILRITEETMRRLSELGLFEMSTVSQGQYQVTDYSYRMGMTLAIAAEQAEPGDWMFRFATPETFAEGPKRGDHSLGERHPLTYLADIGSRCSTPIRND